MQSGPFALQLPVRYTSDKTGPLKGVPYDALQTILDGKGKWLEGMDPVDLYGPPHTIARGPRRLANDPLLSPFANQFMWRVDDAITKYHSDVIYFDEHAGDSQTDLGVHMGLGFLAPQLAATSRCIGTTEKWKRCSTSRAWVTLRQFSKESSIASVC